MEIITSTHITRIQTQQSDFQREAPWQSKANNTKRGETADRNEGEIKKRVKKTTREEVKLWKTDLLKGRKHNPQFNRAGNAYCEDRMPLRTQLRECMKLIVTSCCLVNRRRLIDEDKRSGWWPVVGFPWDMPFSASLCFQLVKGIWAVKPALFQSHCCHSDSLWGCF